jgi:hypothetical protein
MELIPLITMKKRKILENESSKENILDTIDSDSKIYIYDLDGINKDKPNLCTLQKYSSQYELWMDSGPRDLGDVVDSILAGAERVTIRKKLFPQININEIREITENPIFSNIEINYKKLDELRYLDVDGFVNFYNIEEFQNKNEINQYINQLKNAKPIYAYEKNPSNINYWQKIGIKYLLVNANKLEEFKLWLQRQKSSLPFYSNEAAEKN